MAVFWVVAPCSLVEVYRRFRGACCLHHQGDRPSSFLFVFVCHKLFAIRKRFNKGTELLSIGILFPLPQPDRL
jgi:hypothetical protein